MRWVLVAVAIAAGAAALIVLVGLVLPRAHTATRTAELPAPPQRVWSVIRDVAAYPSWRPDLRAVEPLPDTEGRQAWREVSGDGRVSYEIVEAIADRRLVTRITDRSLPYGGSWVIELAPAGSGTRITVTEHGEIYNPVFRVVARFVIGYTATMDRYLAALERRLAAPVAPAADEMTHGL
jgi:uncharacterized protein YndB with AHSA1/START domain